MAKIENSNPIDCLNLTFEQSIGIIKDKIGKTLFDEALDTTRFVKSPVSACKDTGWCQTLKIIGINPRITKTYMGILKYALSFPEQGIHLMPLFETGDGSLYVQNSWELNKDFFDEDLKSLGFNTCSEQLKFIINILHAMGKIVGFDALLHCDNFSQIVLLNPKLFEWVKLNQDRTFQIPFDAINYNELYIEVQNIIIEHLNLPKNIFDLSEKERQELIFPDDIDKFKRRMELRKVIRDNGLEPIPVVEHAPGRPIIFDKIERKDNEDWAVFKVENKSTCAKIFGSITPYGLYYLDKFGYPQKKGICAEAWDYFSDKINSFQREYNFDFLRADMAHNQYSHSHRDKEKDINCPEIWTYTKNNIQENKPYFATVAEAFYSKYYIDGISDMINKDFDIVIGEMNYKNLDKEYLDLIDDYVNPFRQNFFFYPSMTIYTNDGDLKINNRFYISNKQNLLRCFISLFLNLPSYMGMGFELRDINPKYDNNYSNCYVAKQEKDYAFGGNVAFLDDLTKIRNQYYKMKDIIENYDFNLIYSTNNKLSLCFEYEKENIIYLFIANLNEKCDEITLKKSFKDVNLIFSSNNKTNCINLKDLLKFNIKPWEFSICKCFI